MPSELKENFWEFGYFYYAKSLILNYSDLDTRASLAFVSHDFSHHFILDELNPELYPKDKLTEHRRLRQLKSVLSHYYNLNYINKAWPNSIFLPELNTEQYAMILQQIEDFPADVSKLVIIDQSQLLKAKFIFDTFASENLDEAIRSKNKAMLGVLLANRFVNRTMTLLWHSERQQSLLHRRAILMGLLHGLSSLFLHLGLVALSNLGGFSFVVKLGNFCLSFDIYIVSLMESSWIFFIIIVGLSVVLNCPLYCIASLLFFGVIAFVYTMVFGLNDLFLSFSFLESPNGLAGHPTQEYSILIYLNGLITILRIFFNNSLSVIFFPINLVVFVLGALANYGRYIQLANELIPLSPFFERMLLSFPATIFYAALVLPVAVLASAVIHSVTLIMVAIYSMGLFFVSIVWGLLYLLSATQTSYQDSLGDEFKRGFIDIFSFYSSSHESIFTKLQLLLAPQYKWVQSRSSFSESNLRCHPESESMLNLARMVSIAESAEDKTFTPKEQVTFILKEHLKKHSGVLSFFKADTTDTVFFRSLLNDISVLSIAEIDFRMEDYKNKTSKRSLSEEFIALADYVQHVLLPMEERETYRENPSLEALYERVPLLRRTDALWDFKLPTSYPVAA